MRKVIDLTGKYFGRLQVLGYAGRGKRGEPLWSCGCSCGNLKTLSGIDLRGGYRSCGCGSRKSGTGDPRDSVLRSYKYIAKKRNFCWKLTDEQFDALTQGICHYCGTVPSNAWSLARGTFIYNGIDRIDNKRGYLPENCVSCCKICNRAKLSLSYSDFMKFLERVRQHKPLSHPYLEFALSK